MHHGEAILGFLEASPYSRMKKLPVAWVCCPGGPVIAVIGYISQIDFSHCLLKLGDLGPVFHHRQVSCVIRAKVLLLPSIATNPPTHHGQVLEEVHHGQVLEAQPADQPVKVICAPYFSQFRPCPPLRANSILLM